MKNRLIIIVLAILASQCIAFGAMNVVDPENPINMPDDSTVIFGGRHYALNQSMLYLDGSLAEAVAPFVFNDVAKALDAASHGDGAVTLLVAPWVYWLDDPDDPQIKRDRNNSNGIPYAVELRCDSLKIVGLTADPKNVVFAANRGQTQGALGNFTMVHFLGSSLEMENVTFGNYCNVDLEYPLCPEMNRAKRNAAIVQAQIGICDGTDRLFARNCRFISRLNMCPFVGARRSLFKDCYMECTDDALSGTAVYLDCRFTWFSTKPFYGTSKTGAVFLNCDIDLVNSTSQYITKAPGMVTIVDSRFNRLNKDYRRIALQWTRDSSHHTCYQSNVQVDGESYLIDAERPQLSVDITDRLLLDAYKVEYNGATVYNTPNLLAGDDGWDPLGMRPTIEKLQELTGRKLLGIPVMADFGTGNLKMQASGDKVSLIPMYRRWGDYPTADDNMDGLTEWAYPDCLKLYSEEDGTVTCVSGNVIPKSVLGDVTMTNEFGWRAKALVEVAPYLKAAPEFVKMPSLVYDKKLKAIKLDYSLSGIVYDESFVAWYRRDEAGDTVRIRHGRVPGQSIYNPEYADKGHHIFAVITPKGDDTEAGEKSIVEFGELVADKHLKGVERDQHNLSTDFSDIPVHYQPKVGKGLWTFDAYKPIDTKMHDWDPAPERGWYYGRGTDGAVGVGLVQMTKGARMFYSPYRDKSDNMSVSLTVEPCKPVGQGFGSATGQYMDVYIKFDPSTLSGYALRIERTPAYDRAVVFTLMRYDKGVATPISDSVASNCYRTPCNINLSISDGVFTASASTTAAPAELRDGVLDSVSLSAAVSATPHSALGIQHTGSTGASATLISKLDAEWR